MISGLYTTPIKNRCSPASPELATRLPCIKIGNANTCETEALRAGGGQATGALHHIIAKGIERKRIFTDGVDRDN